jgi:hypothetical protein
VQDGVALVPAQAPIQVAAANELAVLVKQNRVSIRVSHHE